MILKRYQADDSAGWQFRCPGCKHAHLLITEGEGTKWKFSGDTEMPTFSPSLITRFSPTDPEEVSDELFCHLFIRDGKIEYLSDCTHSLAGRTVEMVEW